MNQVTIRRFPAEVWAMIFHNLDDYEDVVNMSQAYPEMETLLRKVKHLGLFEGAITHIAEWLPLDTLLSCRLVCKQWAKGVDNFLQSCPPPLPTHKLSPQPHPPFPELRKASLCELGRRYCDPSGIFRTYFEEMHAFTNEFKFDKFLLKMEGHPPHRNPFLGRAIKLNLVLRNDRDEVKGLKEYWECALRLLQKWGSHIWYLGISLDHNQPRRSCQYLKESLWLLPNLRGLKVEGDTPWYFEVMDMKWKKHLGLDDLGTFPELPHLGNFYSSYRGMPQLGDTLMSRYSTQLRRLQILLEPNWTWSWSWGEEKYANLLPNLIELEIDGYSTGPPTGCFKEKLNQILLALNAPNLRSLLVRGYWGNPGKQFPKYVLGKEDVQRWLRRFPALTNLHLPDEFVTVVAGCPESPNIWRTSVKTLGLHISSLNGDLLLGFPEVQTLHIYCANGDRVTHYMDISPGTGLRKLAASNWELVNVWKLLPKLNKLCIAGCTRDCWGLVSREEYEEYLT